MQWLNKIADEVAANCPEGEILISSGGSPSGTHHLGHLRELTICDAILRELRHRGREVKHIYYVDDLDGLRKIPVNVKQEYEKYLGVPLCDVPAPDGSRQSYADFFIGGLIGACQSLGIEVEFIRSHKKYREGFFISAIEKALDESQKISKILEEVSGHKLGDSWSPIQVMEGEYLKKRPFVSIDKKAKKIIYLDKDAKEQEISYSKGEVKLDWRIDWPARWWLLGVDVEPFGRDHSTKGGSYDTGEALVRDVFGGQPPLAVPYDFINMAGDTKKMSASKGTGLDAESVVQVLPPEIVRYFILSSPPGKRLYFDAQNGVAQLIDEFAELMEKQPDSKILELSRVGTNPVISRVPFTHLVASYQASLRDSDKTIEILKRTEYGDIAKKQAEILKKELAYIGNWLDNWAPDDVKFELRQKITAGDFSVPQKKFLSSLAEKIAGLPAGADGELFHKAIYDLGQQMKLEPKTMFETLYKALIGKNSGPRAGWFLSILPRDWLIKRLNLEA